MTAPRVQLPSLIDLPDPGVIRVLVWDIREGGLDDGDATRLRRQVDLIASAAPTVVGLMEVKGWEPHGRRLQNWVESRLGLSGYLTPSGHDGCHMLMLLPPDWQIIEERHVTGAPWWHGLGHLLVRLPGRTRPLRILITHASPASPEQRLIEAQCLELHARRHTDDATYDADLLVLGEWNAAPAEADEPDQPPDVDPVQLARKLRRDAAEAIEELGLIDVAASTSRGGLADPTPTIVPSHRPTANRALYRATRIYIRGALRPLSYHVLACTHSPALGADARPDSDHRPVLVDLATNPTD